MSKKLKTDPLENFLNNLIDNVNLSQWESW